MIICQCNVISRKEIEEVTHALLQRDPWRAVTPGLVYKELGKQGKCCGCIPTVVDIIVETLESMQHAATDVTRTKMAPLANPHRMRQRKSSLETFKKERATPSHERQRESY